MIPDATHVSGRAYEPLTPEHLRRLGELAAADRESLFRRKPRLAPLADHILCVALCQGAALHYVDGRNGVKDLDVWTFFATAVGVQYPPRLTHQVSGQDMPGLTGWSGRVDILGRSLDAEPGTDPAACLRAYLRTGRTETARQLSRKAVVLISPADRMGEIVWPVPAPS